jgi:hypothetical protein
MHSHRGRWEREALEQGLQSLYIVISVGIAFYEEERPGFPIIDTFWL